MRVISRREDRGIVEAGGIQYDVSFRLLPETRVDDYVIVHAGFAIQKLDVADAETSLKLFQEMERAVDRTETE
jgi:hydrogenase expression/formation protein HypC